MLRPSSRSFVANTLSSVQRFDSPGDAIPDSTSGSVADATHPAEPSLYVMRKPPPLRDPWDPPRGLFPRDPSLFLPRDPSRPPSLASDGAAGPPLLSSLSSVLSLPVAGASPPSSEKKGMKPKLLGAPPSTLMSSVLPLPLGPSCHLDGTPAFCGAPPLGGADATPMLVIVAYPPFQLSHEWHDCKGLPWQGRQVVPHDLGYLLSCHRLEREVLWHAPKDVARPALVCVNSVYCSLLELRRGPHGGDDDDGKLASSWSSLSSPTGVVQRCNKAHVPFTHIGSNPISLFISLAAASIPDLFWSTFPASSVQNLPFHIRQSTKAQAE